MKMSGICGKQSARKHRKAGHYVAKVWGFPGRYQWVNSGDHRYVQLTGNTPTGVILDDIVDEPKHMDVPTERGSVTITQGSSYWPKRRNQHSKPYYIVGFSRGFVQHVRNDPFNDDEIVYSTPAAFVSLIGKPV